MDGSSPWERNPTLQDMAKALNISAAAVSMALRDQPRISRELRERVKKAASEIGYVPDLAMARAATARRRGASQPTLTVGLVQPDPERMDPDGWRDAMGSVAAENGFRCDYFNVRDLGGAARTLGILRARGIEDLIFLPHTRPLLGEWPLEEFYALALRDAPGCPSVDVVLENWQDAYYDAFNRVRALGWRRIGFAILDHDQPGSNLLARIGLAAEISRRDGPAIPPFVGAPESSKASFLEWVRAHRPEVVLGQTSYFYWLMKDYPKRFSHPAIRCAVLQGADDEMSGYHLNSNELLRFAFSVLRSKRMLGLRGVSGTARHMFPMRWFEGSTLGARPAASPASGVRKNSAAPRK